MSASLEDSVSEARDVAPSLDAPKNQYSDLFDFFSPELRVISANPEVIALQTLSESYRPLDMDMQCRCGY